MSLLVPMYHIPPEEEVEGEWEVRIIKQLVAWGYIDYLCPPGKTSYMEERPHSLQSVPNLHTLTRKKSTYWLYLPSVPLHLDSVQFPPMIYINSYKMKLRPTFPTSIHSTPFPSTVFQPHWHGWKKGMFMISAEPATIFLVLPDDRTCLQWFNESTYIRFVVSTVHRLFLKTEILSQQPAP